MLNFLHLLVLYLRGAQRRSAMHVLHAATFYMQMCVKCTRWR